MRHVAVVLAACLLVSAGCMWSRVKINGADVTDRARAVKPAVTQAKELQSLMGQPPNHILPLKNGKQLYVYTSGDSKTKAFDIIVLSISKTNVRTDAAYLLVNEQGVVESAAVGTPAELPWEWWAFGD